MTFELFNDDNLAVLRRMPDNSVDAVITSPPYDNLRKYGGHTWDFEGVATELTRVLKRGGVIVWNVADATVDGSETFTSLRQALFFKDVCGLKAHDTMIYQTNKPPLTHNRYDPAWEYMFVFSKGTPRTWNPLKEPAKCAGQKRCATMRQDGDGLSSRSAKGRVAEEKMLSNLWYLPRSSHTDGAERKGHPATFPLELPLRHIQSWTNARDIVLDPFMGSGTTGVACGNLDRRFIGMEIDTEHGYFQIAEARVSAAFNKYQPEEWI